MSTASLGSTMMPPPSQDLLHLAASGARPQLPGSNPSSPDSANGLLDLDTFCKCMEEAVKSRRCAACMPRVVWCTAGLLSLQPVCELLLGPVCL
jgi:hypothetical protein